MAGVPVARAERRSRRARGDDGCRVDADRRRPPDRGADGATGDRRVADRLEPALDAPHRDGDRPRQRALRPHGRVLRRPPTRAGRSSCSPPVRAASQPRARPSEAADRLPACRARSSSTCSGWRSASIVAAVVIGAVTLWPSSRTVEPPAGPGPTPDRAGRDRRDRRSALPRPGSELLPSDRRPSSARATNEGARIQLTVTDPPDRLDLDVGDAIRVSENQLPPEAVIGGVKVERYSLSDFERRTPLFGLALAFAAARHPRRPLEGATRARRPRRQPRDRDRIHRARDPRRRLAGGRGARRLARDHARHADDHPRARPEDAGARHSVLRRARPCTRARVALHRPLAPDRALVRRSALPRAPSVGQRLDRRACCSPGSSSARSASSTT